MEHPYKIGENYFVRTVTHHYTGKLRAVYDHEIVLTSAAWIPVDGRFAQAVEKGEINECEPYPEDTEVIIGRGGIIDTCIITWPLPRVQK